MVRVAVAQFAPGEDKGRNLARIGELVAAAAARGADIVVLPEYSMFTARRMDQRFVESAEPPHGEFGTALRGLATEHGVAVVAGMNEAIPGEQRIFNTLVAVGADGAVVARYRKLHLYDAFGFRESAVVRAGELTAPETFPLNGFTFGLQTCYDLRFPEVTRWLADAGVSAVLVPADWVPGPLKEDHWTTLVRARAIENTVYLAAADQAAPTGAGGSMVVDPMGVVLSSLGERTGVAVGELEPDRLAEVRRVNPALSLRRFTTIPKP